MGRNPHADVISYFPGATQLGATYNSNPFNVRDIKGLSLFLKWSGAGVDGTFKIQISTDKKNTPTNWDDLGGSDVVAAGASQNNWIISNAFYTWIRVVFTRNSGTGTIDEAYFAGPGSL